MKTVTIHEAKTQLSKYLVEIEENGEEIIIARRDKPVARLIPIKDTKVDRSGMFGSLKEYISEQTVEYLTDQEQDQKIENDFIEAIESD